MFLIASKMIACLIIATLIGIVIGYLLCKMCKECQEKKVKGQTCCAKEENTSCSTTINGAKPLAYAKEDVQPDELKKISGVGPQLEGKLNELGIYTFKQIAQWNEENVAWVDEYLSFKGRISRENWIEQAKILAEGKETEFSKRFDS